MSDGRRHSRERRQEKLSRREEIESRLRESVEDVLRTDEPTIMPVAAKMAAVLASVVVSQIAAQPQSVQRSLRSIEEDATDYATEFVAQLVAAARRGVKGQVRKIAAAPAPDLGLVMADDWAGPVAGPTLLETNFGIPRSTLYRWQKINAAVALNTRTSKKPVFPLRQFVDGRPAPGLSDVIAVFGDHRKTWMWLVTSSPDFADTAPLDHLLEGRVPEVIAAAAKAKELIAHPRQGHMGDHPDQTAKGPGS